MANLYGAIYVPEAFAIIARQNPELHLTHEEFNRFLLIARHEKHLEINGLADTFKDEET